MNRTRYERINVIALNLRGADPLAYSDEEYRQFFFGQGVTSTPGGHPVFGSVSEWFLQQSNMRFHLEGDFLGTYSVDESWENIWDENEQFLNSHATHRQGRQWLPTIVEMARTALVRAGRGIDRMDRLVIICNGRELHGLQWGPNVVTIGSNVPNDLFSLGAFTHELGHLIFNQPDRYGKNEGALGTWDNMGDSYSNFPSGYSAQGRVQAGWAGWAQAMGPDLQRLDFPEINIPVLGSTMELPRWRSRMDDPEGKHSFFALEHRRAVGTDHRSNELPAEGLLLSETNRNGLPQILRPLTIEERDLFDQEGGRRLPFNEEIKVRYHREAHDQLANAIEFRELAPVSSYAVLRNDAAGFNCENAKSVNFLGECLWEFRNVRTISEQIVGGVDIKMQVQPVWKPVAVTNHITPVPTARTSRRLYLTLRGRDTLRVFANRSRLLSDPPHSIVNLTVGDDSPTSIPYTYIVDIDPIGVYGGRIEIGENLQIVEGWIVSRAHTLGQFDIKMNRGPLPAGAGWLSYREKIRAGDQADLSVSLPDFEPERRRNQAEERPGYLRVLFEFEDSENLISEGQPASEEEHYPSHQDMFPDILLELKRNLLTGALPLCVLESNCEEIRREVPSEVVGFTYCNPGCRATQFLKVAANKRGLMSAEIPVTFLQELAYLNVRRYGGQHSQKLVIRTLDSVLFP